MFLSTRTNDRNSLPVSLERPPIGQFIRQVIPLPTKNLEHCLSTARRRGERLGQVLLREGLATRGQLKQVFRLQAQWVAKARQADLGKNTFPYPTRLSLCLPAYNEESNILDTLEGTCAILPEFVEHFEVIVVDDGSTDRTAETVSRFSEREPRVTLVSHDRNRGYGAAVTTGLRAAQGDLVVFTDSDGQFSLLDLPQLLTQLEGNDLVIGYRYRRADPWLRRLNAWSWNRLVHALLGVRVRDLDCAFKVFRRSVVDALQMTATGACVNAEIMVQCIRAGLKLRETPVLHYERKHGAPTGANFRVILRAFRELPRLFAYRSMSNRSLQRLRAEHTPSIARPKRDEQYINAAHIDRSFS